MVRNGIGIADAVSGGMNGFITERNLAEAEVEFPGIEVFYRGLRSKPSTFLELLRLYSVDPALDVDGAGASPSDSRGVIADRCAAR